MFDQLSERLQTVLGGVRSRGKLSDEDVNAALREVRLALLEADLNFKVVKDFTAALRERLAGEEVSEALNPGQTVIKAVNDELTALMGGAGRDLVFAPSGPPPSSSSRSSAPRPRPTSTPSPARRIPSRSPPGLARRRSGRDATP